MTLPVYPYNMPRPVITGHSIASVDEAQRSAIGPAVSRRRTAYARGVVTAKWVLSDASFAVFEAFWFSVLSQGASWFTAQMSSENGNPYRTARFQGGYQARAAGGMWEVTAKLDIEGQV